MKIIGLLFCLMVLPVHAAKLAIVIDDFGYRPKNEQKIIALSPEITVAVLPNAPNARSMAEKAHQRGNDVIIHLPMAPLSQQPLEKDTIKPGMGQEEIQRIIMQAVDKVPYAIGLNNHMGSAATSNLSTMQKVMKALSILTPPLFFLDSKTVAKSQVSNAAKAYNMTVLQRDIFLDDTIDSKVIRQQFLKAVSVAKRKGIAIAIGHPHPQTIQVLMEELPKLPVGVELVRLSNLLPQNHALWRNKRPVKPLKLPVESTEPVFTAEQKIYNTIQLLIQTH